MGERGFKAMSKDRHQQIAKAGGIAAHKKGTAHEWTAESAREAGRKGGLAAAASRSRRRLSAAVTGNSLIDVGADVPGGGAI